MPLSPVMETSGRAVSPLRVLHEAPCDLIPRLVEGTDALDELRGRLPLKPAVVITPSRT